MRYKILRPRRRKIRSFLRRCHYLFLALGLGALGYCGIILLHTAWFQERETRAFEQALQGEAKVRHDVPPARLTGTVAALKPTLVREGSVVGRLEIPSLGIATIVLEGSDSRILRRAVGHIPGTALPWQPGNVGIAGHRDTFFRPLRKINRGDEITLTTLQGSYHYRVESTRVVDPADTSVLSSSQGPTLTLVTCFPFYYVGSAPKRFVVRASKVPELASKES